MGPEIDRKSHEHAEELKRPSSPDDIKYSIQEDLDTIIDQFQSRVEESKDGSKLFLSQFVDSLTPEMVNSVVVDLVNVHLEPSWRFGSRLRVEDYASTLFWLDSFKSVDNVPLDIFEREYVVRHVADPHADHPHPSEYKERFPLREDVHELLNAKLLGNGRYSRIRSIGEGGFARVWLAFDFHLKRMVAIKIPRMEFADGQMIASRLSDEARRTANLNHPSIVTILEWVDHDTNIPFYVMPVVSGETLETKIHDVHARRIDLLPVDAAVAEQQLLLTLADVCDAVAYAHSRGVIHRDLKPSNVKVGPYGETIVLDWGLARPPSKDAFREPPDDGSAFHTIDTPQGQVIDTSKAGTPGFVAPEQFAQGRSDERTDVYAIGAILYQILTGRSTIPFQSFPHNQLALWMKRPVIEPPRSIRRDLPPRICAICMKSLETDPSRRYSSPQEIKDDLNRYMADEPVTALSEFVFSRERVFRWMRRHRHGVTVAASVLVVIAIVAAWQWRVAAKEAQSERRLQLHANLRLASEAYIDGALDKAANLLRQRASSVQLGDWEWNYLVRAIASEEELRITNSGGVSAVRVFMRDQNEHLAVAAGNEVSIWTSSGELLRTLTGHDGPITRISVSPNGTTLASASADTNVLLWNTRSGKRFQTLGEHISEVNTIAFSYDGRVILTGSSDSTLKLWDARSGNLLSTIQGDFSNIWSARFIADSESIAVVGKVLQGSHVVANYNSHTNLIASHQPIPAAVIATSFSPDGREVAVLCGDGKLRRWRLDNEIEPISEVSLGSHSISDIILDVGSQQLFCGSRDTEVKVFDLNRGRLLRRYRGHRKAVRSISLSHDSQQLVSASDDGTVTFWNAQMAHDSRRYTGHVLNIRGVEFLPKSNRFVTCSDDRTVRLWDLNRGEIKRFGELEFERHPITGNLSKLRTWGGHRGLVMDVAVDPAERYVASAGHEDRQVILWDLEAGNVIGRLRHPMQLSSVSVSENYIAAGCWDDNVWLWNAETRDLFRILDGHSDDVSCVQFSPDGKLLASGSKDTNIRIWDVETGHLIQVLKHHQDEVSSLAFSVGGEWFASGSDDTRVCLWKVNNNRIQPTPVHVLLGHTKSIGSLSFNNSGTRLASTTFKGDRIRLWDTRLGVEAAVLEGKSRVCFSSEGNLLAVCDGISIKVLDGTPIPGPRLETFLRPPSETMSRTRPDERREVDRFGDVKALGYVVHTRQSKEGAHGTGHVETVLGVPISFPYYHGQTDVDIDRGRIQAAIKNGESPPPPASHSASIKLGYFRLLLKDGRELAPVEWRSWPDNGTLGGTSYTFTSSERITKLDRDVKLFYWSLPADAVEGPFRVRIRDFKPIWVPSTILKIP